MIRVDTQTHWIVSKRGVRRWTAVGLALSAVGLAIAWVTRDDWLTAVGRFLVVQAPLRAADAIVVVSQGLDDRPIYAAKLYAAGYAPLVITLGGVTPQSGAQDTGAARDAGIARNWGVPEAALVLLDDTANMCAEAARSRQALLARGATSAIVLSDAIHLRRAALTFGRLYEQAGITYIPVADPKAGFAPEGWWRRKNDAMQVALEYSKIGLVSRCQ